MSNAKPGDAQGIFTYPQWICWHQVEGRKIPFDPASGYPINPHDPRNWKTHWAAISTGAQVGFVLTADDPWFCIDLDGCWTSGGWSAEARAVCELFPGAPGEISHSGRGLHIMGRCNKPMLAGYRNKWDGGKEFYIDKRFIAMGRGFKELNCRWDIDWTSTIADLVPKREVSDDRVSMMSGPVPGYTGPVDNGELIALMLRSRGSIAAQFGQKASFRDLWEARADVLSQHYKSPGTDVYDRSSADAAIMSHLAFWTGKDAARMDRLFRQSKLMRGKWERSDYREGTINNAIAGCKDIYTRVSVKSGRSSAALDVDDNPSVTLAKLIEGYGYCPSRFKNVVPLFTDDTMAGMTFPNFKLDLKKYDPDGSMAELWTRERTLMTIEDLRMRPDQQRPIYEERGKTFVNTYSPPTHDAEGGAIDVGIEFLAHLLPIAIEREWFTKWLAFKFRHPAIPGPAVVMVASNQFGTGRGTLAKILERLFGQRYVKSMPFANLVGSTYQSQYNDFLAEALIAVTNESSDVAGSGRYANSMNNYERIKEIVDPAPRMVRFNRKGLSNFDGLSFTTFLIATNHQDALPVPANDRRFAVLSNGQPMTDESKSKVHEWIASDANIAAFANHLNSIDISDYNPFADPIMTDAKRAMADMARSDLDRAASEVINSTLCGEVFTVDQIIRRLETWRLTTTNCDFPDRWSIIARKIIERTCIRVGIRHGVNWVTTINGKRHPVYAVSQNLARKWTQSTVLREEVLKNDFYVPSDIVPFPRLVQP